LAYLCLGKQKRERFKNDEKTIHVWPLKKLVITNIHQDSVSKIINNLCEVKAMFAKTTFCEVIYRSISQLNKWEWGGSHPSMI
jgi:hypothetical protein